MHGNQCRDRFTSSIAHVKCSLTLNSLSLVIVTLGLWSSSHAHLGIYKPHLKLRPCKGLPFSSITIGTYLFLGIVRFVSRNDSPPLHCTPLCPVPFYYQSGLRIINLLWSVVPAQASTTIVIIQANCQPTSAASSDIPENMCNNTST